MDFDVIVIGSGQAGVPLATRFARNGKRVLLAERGELGGTCINTGCTPTKTMVASARAAQVVRTCDRLGVHAGPVRVDFAAVIARKDRVVAEWRASVQRRLQSAGERLTLRRAAARFVGAREVDVGGERHRGDTIIVNTGARAACPPIPGLAGVPWLDNRRVMALPELPEHLVILGGGYIACEFGQMFRRFGAKVTIIERNTHLLHREDPAASTAIEEVFRNEGITLRLGQSPRTVAQQGGEIVVRADGGEVRGSHLLVALGRTPNTEELGCDAAGIQLDKHGAIVADDRYRTSAEGVYAVGDVLGGPQFTHTSWDDHRILFELLRGKGTRTRADRLIPSSVFTDPQVAHVGLYEHEAKAQGRRYEVASMPFANIARAVETDETAGVLKVLVDPDDERILGATIVGSDGGELIHIFVDLMEARASARAIVDAEHIHPTFAEGVQTLVMQLPRYALD